MKSSAGAELEKARPEPGRYFALRRTWSPGDTVELSLPMRVRLIEGHHLIEETRGQAAVLRGPVVYCIETPDVGPGAALADFAVPRNAQLRPVEQTIGQTRVIALEGEILQYEHQDWGSDLYREVSGAEPRRVRVRMVPYFCWDNRGSTEMSIWLPLA